MFNIHTRTTVLPLGFTGKAENVDLNSLTNLEIKLELDYLLNHLYDWQSCACKRFMRK